MISEAISARLTSPLAGGINSEEVENYGYCHSFVLHLWRRKDPETGSAMPGELSYLIDGKKQPEFSVSNVVNQYFYHTTDANMNKAVRLRHTSDPIEEEQEIIKILIEDVLPHGYAEA